MGISRKHLSDYRHTKHRNFTYLLYPQMPPKKSNLNNARSREARRKRVKRAQQSAEQFATRNTAQTIRTSEGSAQEQRDERLRTLHNEKEVKHIDTFVKNELGDYSLEQPNYSVPAGENAEEKGRDLKECYEHVNQFSEQSACINDLESRSDIHVQQINYSDNCIKQEVDDCTFSPVSDSDQSNQADNIVKQELDGYSVLSTNSADQVDYSDECIKQELDDITFSTNSVDPLEDKTCLELSRSDCCVENESEEYGNVDDQLNLGNSKLKRFESVFCDLYIKAEEPSEKSVETSLESNEHTQNINNENEKYKCIFCNSSFSNRTSLVRHIVDFHFEKDIYLCEFCNDTFESKQGVNKHINAIHVKKKGNICTFCKAVFTTNEKLRIHIDSIHLKRKNYRPRVLTYKYNNDVQFKRKKFSCLFCKASFGSQMGVSRHITITHVRKKRYICYLCDASYTTERYLNTHLEKIHLEKSTPTNNPPQVQKDKAAEIPVDQSNSSNLIKTLNHNLDTYLKKRSESICLFPKASFTTDRNLKTHIDNIDPKKESITSNVEQSFNYGLEKDVDTAIPVDQSNKFPWRYSP
ncbi:hypothetical protein WA026_009248 [Henosepilachna vigintioctopunctata]|uniref:C2H2-type domain-containing protein n=1 Tax=Henosepilachna vigintioctopunctata TaxID=420089 RepID=A0AAW1UWZ2_9CUCU